LADGVTRAPVFLLFSGHNDRAVVALCRYFTRAGLPFAIVAAGRDDPILRTDHKTQVQLIRTDRQVDLTLLRSVGALAAAAGGPLVYCPTTEYINDFVLRARDELAGCGLQFCLPDGDIYARLTGKRSSQELMRQVPGVNVPQTLPMNAWRAPCVLKPIRNVDRGAVLYPLLCDSEPALQQALDGLDTRLYFAQEFVRGQSHYLCGYLARDGRHVSFWQENLMQQPRGKSIVLARTGRNPGVDADALMSHLHRAGYHGPLMVEFIVGADGPYYIEINPRFWGPLQLALDACPALLDLYAHDHGARPRALPTAQAPHYYAWSFGARTPHTVVHPAGAGVRERERLLRQHDVYARPDTAPLHDCH
jgi:hypothetical protein